MIVVLGVVDFEEFLLKIMYVSKMLSFGSGFVFIKNRIDFFVWVVCLILIGFKILWLMVLFRNNIFVGFIKMLVIGSKLVCIIIFILVVNNLFNVRIIGLMV